MGISGGKRRRGIRLYGSKKSLYRMPLSISTQTCGAAAGPQLSILNSFLEAGPRVSDSIRQQATSNLFIDKLSQLAYVKYIEKYD